MLWFGVSNSTLKVNAHQELIAKDLCVCPAGITPRPPGANSTRKRATEFPNFGSLQRTFVRQREWRRPCVATSRSTSGIASPSSTSDATNLASLVFFILFRLWQRLHEFNQVG